MKHKTWFRLALRLVGILLLGQSLPWLIAGCGAFAFSMVLEGSLGLGYVAGLSLQYALVHLLTAIIGFYLFFGGTWIVNRVIPSNRPYCPECGYEITGLPPEGLCPECGTPYKQANRSAAG